MCTAINYKTKDHYFGRNLDLEYSYQEEVVVTPRNYCFPFMQMDRQKSHYAIIGMATVSNDYPLYYEGTNEYGLSMAGLNFPGNAHYQPIDPTKDNIAPFELIPWILGSCKNIQEARVKLERLNIAEISFSEQFPTSPLHWILSYKQESLVIEQTKKGLAIYDNPVGVLTNNPQFPYHLNNLSAYQHLTAFDPSNKFSKEFNLPLYSRGMGAVGLPGDYSSTSRFVRAAFVRTNAIADDDEISSVSQYFHLLNSVAMPRGAIMVGDKPEITVYSCCCNADKGIYYYTTYENSQITGVQMFKTDLDSSKLHRFPLCVKPSFRMMN